MPTPWERNLEDTREKLTGWLGTKLPKATEIEVS